MRRMNSQHIAYFGMEYLLAGCTKTEEDDSATKDDVTDLIKDDSENDKTTIEEEDYMEASSRKEH